MIDTADIIDNGNLSSSTNSSFSSVASIKKKPNFSNSRKTRKQDTPSPQIPPRAPVLETLKRTKRELVNKQSFRKGDNVNAKVINCIRRVHISFYGLKFQIYIQNRKK